MFPTVDFTFCRRSFVAGVLLPPILGWTSFSSAQVSEINPAPAFSGEQLVALPTTDWITNGGNVYNQRYSPLDEIDRGNVANLRGVWRARLGGSGVAAKYSGEAQPLVYDGVIYIITGADDVFAISVDSGETLWSYEANLDQAIDTICCGWTNRGVALGEGGKASELMADRKTVAEGAHTAPVLVELAARHGIAMPIVTAVYGLLKGDDPRAVVSDLLARPLRAEQGHPG